VSAHAYRRVTDALDAHGSTGRDHGGQAMYQCPAHEDRTPSLSITDKPDRVLVNCRAGCDTLAALDALGLEWGDLFDNPAVGKWTTSALRSVGAKANGNGRVTLGAVNYKPGAANGETKSLAVKGSKRDLWPDPHSVEGSVVYVVEGEPDAVTAAQLELPAVGVPGAGKWRAEWANRIAAGRDRVVVIGDCDAPGRKATQKWAAAIAEHCADVRVLDLDPGRNDGYDLGDYVAEARDDAERADVRRAIVTAAENSPRVGQVGHPGGPASNGRVEPNSEGGPGGPTPRGVTGLAHPCKLRILDVAHMLATEPPPIPWVVQPLLVEACVTMLAGREGQGKSMLALALASAIGHGANVAGLDCQAGKVLYIDAENGEREAHRRVRGLGVKPGTLVYVEAVGFNLAANVDLIADLVDEHGPSVGVLDSLRSLAPGLDENDSRPAEAALRPVSRLAQDKGLPVLLLHHAGKQGVEYRGSTAIGAAVELGFTLSRREEDPDKRTRRRLACWKSRPAPEPETRWIALESRTG